jgi:predicted nucleic acid-binding protein
MEIVFDSSTLILLAKTGLLRFTIKNYQATIPEAVMKECTGRDFDDAKLIKALVDDGTIAVVKKTNRKDVTRLCKDFKTHFGEAEAIVLALTKKCPLATDDLLAIKACKILNIPFVTAMHFLIRFAAKGALDRKTSLYYFEKLSSYARYDQRILDDAFMRIKGGK